MATKQNQLNNEAILNMVQVAASLLKTADKFFKQYDVTSTQYNVLVILNSATTQINQSDLGIQLVVSRSDITGIIDRLEESGYVTRKDSPEDRRVKFINITGKGRDLIKKVEGSYFETVKQIVRFLNDKEKKSLMETIGKLKKGMS